MERRLGDPRPSRHTISFYDSDDELLTQLVRFVSEGLDAGEVVLVIAAPEHFAELEAVLARGGVDLPGAVAAGRYKPYDAGRTLAALMVDGLPDAGRFAATVLPMVDEAQSRGLGVRAFGEMVALLWAAGDMTAAGTLERFAEDLAETRGVEVLCAYPTSELEPDRLGHLTEVLARHTGVIAPESYRAGRQEDPDAAGEPGTVDGGEQLFVPVPAAIAAARRFVTGALRAFADDPLTDVAALVVSELATNAVLHAGSAFRVGVRRSGPAVRIEVEDSCPARPRQRPTDNDTPGGRGIPLVEEVSARWGSDSSDGGKVVWSDLLPSRNCVR
ncbi:MAG: MEDS domain-containing protein [Acidimicrobiales bacterium]